MTFLNSHEFVIGIEQYYLWSTVEGLADAVCHTVYGKEAEVPEPPERKKGWSVGRRYGSTLKV